MAIERDDLTDDPSRSWVRVTRFEGAPQAVNRALEQASEQLAPVLRSSEGWRRTIGLRSFDGRTAVVLSFWENYDALLGSEGATIEVRKRAASVGLGVDVDRLELRFDEQ